MGQIANCCKAATQQPSDLMDDLKEERKQSIAATDASAFTQVQNSVHKGALTKLDTYTDAEAEAQAQVEAEAIAIEKLERTVTHGSMDIAKDLKDHKTDGDDVKKVKNYEKLDPYQKFEKEFPFFRMDVNGFCLHVREAVVMDLKNEEKSVEHNHYHQSEVSLSSLQKTFESFESWSEFNDPNSMLVKLLQELCPPANACQDDHIWFDIHKIKLVGILWCDGKPDEKITELYHVLQDNQQENIAFNDKEVPAVFKIIFNFSTVNVFEQVAKSPKFAEELTEISEDRIKEVQDTYDEVIEEFIDTVFSEESKLSSADWQKIATKKADWIVQPNNIRAKLYQELGKK